MQAVKKLNEAYKAIDTKKSNKEQLQDLKAPIDEFKKVANKEAQTNSIIAPGWEKVFDNNLNLFGPKYLDFFVKDTAKKCGISAELGIDPDMERLQKLMSEKERIQREIDAIRAKKGAEAEANVENNLKGFTKNKKGESVKEYNFGKGEEREKQIKVSEENGYSTHEDLKSQETFDMKKETRSIKYLGKELGSDYPLGRKPASLKAKQTNLEELDKAMKQISGRTRLTADEMELLDMAAVNAYNATAKFKKDTKDKIANRKPVKDKEGKEKEAIKDYESVALAGADKIQERIQKLREKVFDKEDKAKVEELKEKCKNVNTISFKKVLYQTVLDYYDSFSNL